MRPAARLMRSASATDVPPNFMTTVPFKARKTSSCAAAALAAVAVAACGGGDHAIVARGPLPPAGTPNLGMPLETAVAQLFAVGFPGTGPDAPIVKKLHRRDWGAVVIGPANALAPLQAQVLAKTLRTAGRRGGRPAPLGPASSPETWPGVQIQPQSDSSEPAVLFRQSRAAGKTLSASGVGAGLAPDADLATAAGPAAGTGFSSEPGDAARLTQAAERGWRAGGGAPGLGPFPRPGGAPRDPQQGAAAVGLSLGALREGGPPPLLPGAGQGPAV